MKKIHRTLVASLQDGLPWSHLLTVMPRRSPLSRLTELVWLTTEEVMVCHFQDWIIKDIVALVWLLPHALPQSAEEANCHVLRTLTHAYWEAANNWQGPEASNKSVSSLRIGSPALQKTAAPANSWTETSWEILGQITSSHLPETQKMYTASKCYLKLFSFGALCYTTKHNKNKDDEINWMVVWKDLLKEIIFALGPEGQRWALQRKAKLRE